MVNEAVKLALEHVGGFLAAYEARVNHVPDRVGVWYSSRIRDLKAERDVLRAGGRAADRLARGWATVMP